MNRSTLQFRMKKLGIVRPGREDDAVFSIAVANAR
jgi:hypothetical protein